MLYHLFIDSEPLSVFFKVISSVQMRALAAFFSSLLLSFLGGNWFINQSKAFFRTKTREYAPENHKKKGEMPTMGGIFIIMVILASSLLWSNLASPPVWIFLITLVGFGAIGFCDDWSKIHSKQGIAASYKIKLQWSMAALVALLLVYWYGISTTICFPFFTSFNPDIGLLFIPWVMFVIVSCSNAANLMDGLDGLAVGSLIPNFITFSLISFIAHNVLFAQQLSIPWVESPEIAVMGALVTGAMLGFLWYNAYPAQIFMGDVGSLALGAGLALIAIMAKQELLFLIAGGLFVVETVSVILQVFSRRMFNKRIFKMAPIHHHFELLGWHESKITARFAIISLLLCISALITLIMR